MNHVSITPSPPGTLSNVFLLLSLPGTLSNVSFSFSHFQTLSATFLLLSLSGTLSEVSFFLPHYQALSATFFSTYHCQVPLAMLFPPFFTIRHSYNVSLTHSPSGTLSNAFLLPSHHQAPSATFFFYSLITRHPQQLRRWLQTPSSRHRPLLQLPHCSPSLGSALPSTI